MLAIAGTAYSDDSRTGTFVAWVSPNQQEQTIIRTSPFFPRAVTIASDGTIWVAGDEMKPRTEKPDYSQHIIRRYDKTGKLLGSFLSWAGFETHSPSFPATVYSVLFPLAAGIGWYSPRSNTYVELSLDGAVARRLKTPQHAKTDVIQATACDDGTIFATTSISSASDQVTWGIFALNREKNDWTLKSQSGKWGLLFGCDGNRLATTTDLGTLSWLSTGTR